MESGNRKQETGNSVGLIPPQPPTPELSLFPSTSELAAAVAARYSGVRYRQILELLAREPRCIFECAAAIGCFDHQISGRFSELTKAELIRRTSIFRTKESTGCQAQAYELTLIGRAMLLETGNRKLETRPSL